MIKILIVDDEPVICELIEKTFSYVGFSVLTATTARRAQQLLVKEKPKVVLLDIVMPDKNGLDILRDIKAKDPSVIVIMVTAHQDEDTRRKAKELGADEFIAKPFSHSYLRDVVIQKVHQLLSESGTMKRASILVVDDDADLRGIIKDFVEKRFDCLLSTAPDAVQGINLMKEHPADVIFLDIKMPGMGGLEAIAEFKKMSPEVKIIVISAWKSMEVVNQAVACGASDYMEKPVSLSVLGEKLKNALASRGKLVLKKNQ